MCQEILQNMIKFDKLKAIIQYWLLLDIQEKICNKLYS